MDFSTVERALVSLSRRHPPLSPEVLDLSKRLLDLLQSSLSSSATTATSTTSTTTSDVEHSSSIAESNEYATGILTLISVGESTASPQDQQRWEPLAVGLRLVVDYLEQRTKELPRPLLPNKHGSDNGEEEDDDDDEEEDEGTGLGTGGGGVYAEGPRIPKIAPPSSPTGVEGTTTIPSPAVVVSQPTEQRTQPPRAESPVFELMKSLPEIVDRNVEHPEPRVRSLVAQVVGAYALYATSLLNWMSSHGLPSHSRSQSEESQTNETQQLPHELKTSIIHSQKGRRQIHRAILASLRSHLAMKEPSRENNPSAASDGALDDTTGWRALETNLHALASYIDGCVGNGFVGENDEEKREDGAISSGSYLLEEAHLFESHDGDGDGEWFLSGLQHCSVVHVNRHVRAASAAVLGVLIKSCMRSRRYSSRETRDYLEDLLVESDSLFRRVLKESLKGTLADNWSQVRMAGSVLCRRYVGALMRIYRGRKKAAMRDGEKVDEEEEEEEEDVTVFESAAGDLVPMLLPRMCLNRFYIAQGVKLYSQDTWKTVFEQQKQSREGEEDTTATAVGGGGMGAVARNAAPLCRYYAIMCDADNHAVREAACQGVAELAQKLGKHSLYAEFLAPHVTILLQALLMCFHDESWPVRDEACLACGTFCLAYAEECLPELPTLFERWTEQMTDQIWSVREDAAVALGDAIAAYGPDMLEKVMKVLKKSLPAAKDQPAMSREEYKKLQNDMQAHTGNQLYSCGSLAPKLRKGGAGRIGCGNCAIDRPKAPWEATDGCIYLMRELCVRFANRDHSEREDVVLDDNTLLPLMTELADSCRLSHYPQSDDLRTTLWRQLPPIAEALGKRRFKSLYLDLFIELLAKNLDDRCGTGASQLSIHAAGQCAEELANLIGVGIFRGRLEAVGREDAFDRVMEERRREQMMAKAAGTGKFLGAKNFSPFGPPIAG
mmetsp:Transcript_24365/g.51022  ORF Transcript_24365/g.51022 Transcript_24365/m.51022 type:complete len:949 (+) Transcript_24365:84-2930(+)